MAGTDSSSMQVLKDFAENASCNGLPNMHRAENPFRKAFWSILVLGGAGNFFL